MDKFSPQRSDHQTVNLFQNARAMEQLKKRWYRSSEQVPQRKHLSVNKIKFNILYWSDQTYVSQMQFDMEENIFFVDLRV